MKTEPEGTLLDDVAAHWTESALEVLKAAGVRAISVDMELAAWRLIKQVLHYKLRWQRFFRTPASLSDVMEQVILKAALLVVQQFSPASLAHDFHMLARRSVSGRRWGATERELHGRLVRRAPTPRTLLVPRRTDVVPRLQASLTGVN